MLPNPVRVGLLAFILFIVIDEHCLQAGGGHSKGDKHGKREEGTSSHIEAQTDSDDGSGSGRSGRHSGHSKRRNQEEGTSSRNVAQKHSDDGSQTGHSGRHTSVHEEHARPSDPESAFWQNVDQNPDTIGYHFGCLVIVENDYYKCFGTLVTLEDPRPGNRYNVKLIMPWKCWDRIDWIKAVVKTIHNNAPLVVRYWAPMQFQTPVEEIVVLDVVVDTNGPPLMPVRLAKPNMPLEGVVGVGLHEDGSLMPVSTVDESHCEAVCEYLTGYLVCFCARDDESTEAAHKSPFFVKSSGEWYLAGIQRRYQKARHYRTHSFLGGNVYNIVHEKCNLVEP